MSKDPRDGLKLRLGYEVARDIERTPVIALGVSDAAVRAENQGYQHHKHCIGEQH